MIRGRRIDRNAGHGPGAYVGIGPILGRHRLTAGRLERTGEGVHPGIRAHEHVISRQHRLVVAAAETHRIGKIRSRVAKHVLSGNSKALADSSDRRRREAADDQMVRRRRTDDNSRLAAGNVGIDGICCRQRLSARAPQSRGKSVNARIGGGECIVGR